jgi:hypothetical protein
MSHMPSATARDSAAIAWIARRAEMRIEADSRKRELGHVGLGDDDRAGLAQPLHDDGIGCSRRCFLDEDLRPCPGRFAGNIEKILDADDDAVEGSERAAACGARIAGVGRRPRGIAVHGEAGARPLAFQIGDAR